MTGHGSGVQVRAESVALNGAPEALRRAIEAAPQGGRATFLIHGFKYRPGDPRRDPHRLLFGAGPDDAPRCADWPADLGGLSVGFGWNAWAPHLASLARSRRNGFSEVCGRIDAAAQALAALLEEAARRRPDLRLGVLAHSLGAQVALRAAQASGTARPGRMILLGAAEDADRALAALPPSPQAGGTQVFHIAARHNDPYDAMFEAAAPRIDGRAPRALGRRGLPAMRSDWMDLQIDHPAVAAWLARRGVPLAERTPRVCHRSFFARPGAMALYRRILEDRDAWSIAKLRAAGAPEGLAPRWSRLIPKAPHLRRVEAAAPETLETAGPAPLSI